MALPPDITPPLHIPGEAEPSCLQLAHVIALPEHAAGQSRR